MSVRYVLSAPRPDDHRLHVEATFSAGPAELVFPSWAPGSYLMREFARNMRDLSASTPDGRPVAIERVSRNRWRVAEPGPFVLRYQVYCREKSVRTPYVGEELQFWLPSNVLLYDASRRDQGYTIELDVPAGQVGVCPLGPEVHGPARAVWAVADLDTLMDSPVSVGPFEHTAFEDDGVWHHHWIEPGHNGDLARIDADLKKIVATARELVGGPYPYRRYDFVTLTAAKGHGGLEHKECSILLRPRSSLRDAKEYEELLTLAAHEHFHAWNVKRIHPDTLGPTFRYDEEHYTRELWWLEGGTVFYEERIAFRAGVVDEGRHLARLADLLHRMLETPGTAHQPISESSFDAWVKLYRQGEDSGNSTVSYYLKGAVVLVCLDLEALHLSGGRVGIDDLLRTMWARWGSRGVGYPEGDTLRTTMLELLAGAGIGEAARAGYARTWDQLVDGTGRPDLETALDRAGWDLVTPPGKPGGWLGVKLAAGERVTVDTVREDGPSAGILSPGDELLALDGVRVLGSDLADRLRDAPAGTTLRVLLSRDGRILERSLTTGVTPAAERKIVARAEVDATRAAVRAAFLRGTRAG